MRNRRNVILLFFDLPSDDKEKRRRYTAFVRTIKVNGYMLLQESVYIKLVHDSAKVPGELELVASISPPDGRVMLLPMSIGGFEKLYVASGPAFDFSLFADDTFYV